MSEEKNFIAQLRQDRKVLWIALACGALAALLLFYYIDSQKQAHGKLIPVIIADKNLAKGERLAENLIRVEYWPESFVAADSLGLKDAPYVYGKELNLPVTEGQQILWSYIQYESNASLATGLNAEYNERAVTIAVDEVKSVGGHIKKGDRVDVIGTFVWPGKSANGMPETKTKMLLQCVTVFEAGSSSSGDNGALPATVTLKVTPDEAALLTLAEDIGGRLRLLLRPPDDLKVMDEMADIDFSNIFNLPSVSRERREIIYGKPQNE